MCGRFVVIEPGNVQEQVQESIQVEEVPWLRGLESRYNIAPSQPLLTLSQTKENAKAQFAQMRWGLVPHWANEDYLNKNLFNARSETLRETPSFRDAFRHRRCLIFTNGYYEWKVNGKEKQPYFIHLPEKKLFAFAGLWEQWQPPKGETLLSCTIVTTEAHQRFQFLHARQPVALPRDKWQDWLNPHCTEVSVLQPFFKHNAGEHLQYYPVSSYVNRAGNEGEQCIEEAQIQGELF